LKERRWIRPVERTLAATEYEGWFYAMKNMTANISTAIWSMR